MTVFPQDPFQKVAVFPLTAELVRPRNGSEQGTLQLGRDRVDRPLDDPPAEALTGYHEETLNFYDEECNPVPKTLLVKD